MTIAFETARHTDTFTTAGRSYRWVEGVADARAERLRGRCDALRAAFERTVLSGFERRGVPAVVRGAGPRRGLAGALGEARSDPSVAQPVWALSCVLMRRAGMTAPANEGAVLAAWGDGPVMAWASERPAAAGGPARGAAASAELPGGGDGLGRCELSVEDHRAAGALIGSLKPLRGRRSAVTGAVRARIVWGLPHGRGGVGRTHWRERPGGRAVASSHRPRIDRSRRRLRQHGLRWLLRNGLLCDGRRGGERRHRRGLGRRILGAWCWHPAARVVKANSAARESRREVLGTT